MDKEKLSDVLLGGAGGAIVAAVIAVFFSVYQESVRNSERVEAGKEIIDAKKQVMDGIWQAREQERSHLLSAINEATRAKVEATKALEDAKQSLLYIAEQKEKVDQFVAAVEKGAGVSVDEVAQALNSTVVSSVLESFARGAVVSFNSSSCPKGWREFKAAYGRFIRGIDKSGSSVDPDGQRTVSNIQEDAFQGHLHSIEPSASKAHGPNNQAPHGYANGGYGLTVKSTGEATTQSFYTGARIANETRPKNVSLLYCERL